MLHAVVSTMMNIFVNHNKNCNVDGMQNFIKVVFKKSTNATKSH